MTIRVLVVDDHEPWRRAISSALRKNLQYQVIGEVADGFEAIQTAPRLKPDLIVLDVGLPTLNGIEVARRILTLAPHSKILFLSEESSPEIAEAALGTGAQGYILKSDAGAELLPAIEAIIEGKPFIGARFAPVRRHEVEFCTDESSVLDGLARYTEGALRSGRTAVVAVTSAHRNEFHHRMEARGLDVALAVAEGRYVSLDVADTLATFMVNGWPDEARFWSAMTPFVLEVAKASKKGHRVAGCGECAPSLWRDGHGDAAVRLEHLWDELTRIHDVDIWCGYSLGAPFHHGEDQTIQRICAEHSAVYWR